MGLITKYIYIYIYITKLKKEKIITLLFTLMFSGINILVKTWKDRNWYDGLYYLEAYQLTVVI